MEAARSQVLDKKQGNPGKNFAKILGKGNALEQANAQKRIETKLFGSDRECGEALGSVLKGNLSRRLHTKRNYDYNRARVQQFLNHILVICSPLNLKSVCRSLDMQDHYQTAMNSTNLKLRNLLIALECLELEGPAKEIFLRSFDLTEKFFLEFGDIIEDLQTVKARLKAIDNILEDVIKMIRNLMKTLDKVKDKVELNFWEDQMIKLGNFVNIHTKAVRVYYAYLKNPNNPNSEEMENFLCYASAKLKGARLDLKAFDRVEDDIDDTEVSEAEVKDDESLDKVEESNQTTVTVEDHIKIDRRLDNKSQVKKTDDDIPEVSEKEIDDNIKEKVSLYNIYALEAAGNDENNLLNDQEAKVSSLDDPSLTELDLNVGFVKETEDEKPDAKSNQDIVVNDDDEGVDVKIEISKVSDRGSVTKNYGETVQNNLYDLFCDE